MAEYSAVVWLPNKDALTAMFFQGQVRAVTVWLSERAALNDPTRTLFFRITSMRRVAAEQAPGFVFHIEEGTFATTSSEDAEQIPFTGVFYSPSGYFPMHWNRIEFPEKLLVVTEE